MKDVSQFSEEIRQLDAALKSAKRVLITAPDIADGDSLGSQLALRQMFLHRHPHLEVQIVNDQELPPRYLFLPGVDKVFTPDRYEGDTQFDVGIIVDGGVDRSARLQSWFDKCKTTVFIDHHTVSVDYPYHIRMVEPKASSTTEIIYYLSQTDYFKTPLESEFCQNIYLGLIFDTGFFRHSNTTPEALELGAKLIRTGFDFTGVGEHGMLERTFPSLQLLAYTLSRSQLRCQGKIIWSCLSLETLDSFQADSDDREGIIDHLYLTQGIEVAVLFFELPDGKTKISFRSHGRVNVARFARSLTQCGGGHDKAAGALLDVPYQEALDNVLQQLEIELNKES